MALGLGIGVPDVALPTAHASRQCSTVPCGELGLRRLPGPSVHGGNTGSQVLSQAVGLRLMLPAVRRPVSSVTCRLVSGCPARRYPTPRCSSYVFRSREVVDSKNPQAADRSSLRSVAHVSH